MPTKPLIKVVTLLKTIQIQQHGGLTNFSKLCLEIKIYFLKCSMSDKIAAFPENNVVSQIICIALQNMTVLGTRYCIVNHVFLHDKTRKTISEMLIFKPQVQRTINSN